MRKYLSTLHRQPDQHKKFFAFAVSGGFTLFIFAIWRFVNFGTGGILAGEANNFAQVKKEESASPFASLRSGLASGLDSLRESFEGLQGGLQGVDFQSDYEEMREKALDTYGQ